MHPLIQEIPDFNLLLLMEPEELAGKLLFIRAKGSLNEFLRNFWERRAVSMNEQIHSYPQAQRNQIDLAISEAWSWLVAQGLLVTIPEQGSLLTLSRRAEKIRNEAQFASYKAARLLPKETLHPKIATKVWGAFIRGEFDVAALQAMKGVEVAVRAAASLGNDLIGTGLMRKAFSPQDGPLTDMKTESGERQGRSDFFAGAIASYKNPHSHRDVNLDDPYEALEIILLANHLLRIVDAREKERKSEKASISQ